MNTKNDMDFREMITGLFDTDFLTSEELDTIVKAGEMYAEAKLKNYIKADAAPDGWMENAVAFKDWCDSGKQWFFDNNEEHTHTTEELYKLFKNNN